MKSNLTQEQQSYQAEVWKIEKLTSEGVAA